MTPDQISAETNRFMSIFGSTFLAWQAIENRLFHVYMISIGAKPDSPAGAAYWAVVSFKTRLLMLDASLAIGLKSHALKSDWDKLSAAINKRAERRNELAHFSLGIELRRDAAHHIIRDSLVKANPRTRKGKKVTYDLNHLRMFHLSFKKLDARIAVFEAKLYSEFRK